MPTGGYFVVALDERAIHQEGGIGHKREIGIGQDIPDGRGSLYGDGQHLTRGGRDGNDLLGGEMLLFEGEVS